MTEDSGNTGVSEVTVPLLGMKDSDMSDVAGNNTETGAYWTYESDDYVDIPESPLILSPSSGEGPVSLVRLSAATHQEDLELPVLVGEDDAVGSHRSVLVFVMPGERIPGNVYDVIELG